MNIKYMTDRKRIYLVDDHTLVRAGIRSLIQTIDNVDVVGESGDGIQALIYIRKNIPDLVLLDITLPGLNGLEVAAEIKKHGFSTKVLFLSMHASPEYVAKGLQCGASGFLAKEAAFDELEMAIKSIFSGQRYIGKTIDLLVTKQLEQKDSPVLSQLQGGIMLCLFSDQTRFPP